MVAPGINPVDKALEQVKNRQNFLFVGGAGSGKTESLKRLVDKALSENSSLKIACITHTNKAVEEISGRASKAISASTIHSFLNSLISSFKSDIKSVFPVLFQLPDFEALNIEDYEKDEKAWKKGEHTRYTKLYKKSDARFRLILGQGLEREAFKKSYDAYPSKYNTQLNEYIRQINGAIDLDIGESDPENFKYNETRFDSFKDKTFGHDGLIRIAIELLNNYPVLGNIISSKYDCLFIDEYQDTNPDLLEAFLNRFNNNKISIGLFGDPEQAIYQDRDSGIQPFLKNRKLVEIRKRDNFRSSQPVIDLVKHFRTDGLTQELRLKDGENLTDRYGSTVFLYTIMPAVPEGAVKDDVKELFEETRDSMVAQIKKDFPDFTHLKATNKSIATDAGFGFLYEVFSKRYLEPRERIENILKRMQLLEVDEIIRLYKDSTENARSLNTLISLLNRRGFRIKKVADKDSLRRKINKLVDSNQSALDALDFAVESGLIALSEANKIFADRNSEKLKELNEDEVFQEFSKLKKSGHNTKIRLKKWLENNEAKLLTTEIIENDFEKLDREYLNLEFIKELYSDELKFTEIQNYYEYENDEKSFSTMHKTKGTGIPKVIVVLHEYGFKRDYDFLSCFSGEPPNGKKEVNSRRLLYVACSRAIHDLICVRLVQNQEEADRIGSFFQAKREIKLQNAN